MAYQVLRMKVLVAAFLTRNIIVSMVPRPGRGLLGVVMTIPNAPGFTVAPCSLLTLVFQVNLFSIMLTNSKSLFEEVDTIKHPKFEGAVYCSTLLDVMPSRPVRSGTDCSMASMVPVTAFVIGTSISCEDILSGNR